ncbi:MAG: glycosyl hydrolase family 53 [Lachnospiraceae bacterium]|nr:glycosyl hydrolase family 53 [Lachnospiraceae bacterium]
MEIKGFTYGYDGTRGDFRSEGGIRSQELLYQTGVNWICLAVVFNQETAHSTSIEFDFANSITDRDIIAAVERAHQNGVKVCLKPMVNCKDGVWRAYINFADADFDGNDLYWDKWFKSYGDYMKYYAELAEETGCEMLCIGCEMCGTERKEKHWRKLIAEIRAIYSGKLIYNTNHGHEDDVKWFDAVDYVGTSAYFPVAQEGGASVETMKARWEAIREEMYQVHQKWNKQIVFIEIGCRSAFGCATMPWDFSHKNLPHDEEEQANFYESCLSVFADEPWFAGAFWWDWSTFIYDTREEAAADHGFNIHLKKAEEVLKKWYAKKSPSFS